MRAVDVLLAFPQLVFALLLVSRSSARKSGCSCLPSAISHAPQVARVMRAAALDVCERDFVKAVEIIGVRRSRVMAGEILPNLISPLMVETGLRLPTRSCSSPGSQLPRLRPAAAGAQLGLMINENRIGLIANPWAVVAPAVLIALLTVGLNTFTDAIARVSLGVDARPSRSLSTEAIVRTRLPRR